MGSVSFSMFVIYLAHLFNKFLPEVVEFNKGKQKHEEKKALQKESQYI